MSHLGKLHALSLEILVQFLTLRYRRCLDGSGLFPFFKHFLETEMTKNLTIIVRECIFKNQKLCLVSRINVLDTSGINQKRQLRNNVKHK